MSYCNVQFDQSFRTTNELGKIFYRYTLKKDILECVWKDWYFFFFTLSVFNREMTMITYVVFLNGLKNTFIILCVFIVQSYIHPIDSARKHNMFKRF